MTPAYFQTVYRAFIAPERTVEIRHGHPCPAVDEWLAQQAEPRAHWVFVTAWNPFSEARPDEENRAAQDRLRAELSSRGWTFVEGVGVGLDGWKDEASLLVAVPSVEAGIELGSRYRQAAVVVGRRGGNAEVVSCPRS